jgi:hypothetical protein
MPEDPLPGKCLPATALEARRYRSASKALAARTPRAGRLLAPSTVGMVILGHEGRVERSAESVPQCQPGSPSHAEPASLPC